jgi:hypothetical protein
VVEGFSNSGGEVPPTTPPPLMETHTCHNLIHPSPSVALLCRRPSEAGQCRENFPLWECDKTEWIYTYTRILIPQQSLVSYRDDLSLSSRRVWVKGINRRMAISLVGPLQDVCRFAFPGLPAPPCTTYSGQGLAQRNILRVKAGGPNGMAAFGPAKLFAKLTAEQARAE